MHNKLIPYSLIFILIIPLVGFNFILGLLGNILLLIVLVPLLILGLGLLGINSIKSRISLCENCGSVILGNNDNCPYCGNEKIKKVGKDDDLSSDASEKIVEIKAEEIN